MYNSLQDYMFIDIQLNDLIVDFYGFCFTDALCKHMCQVHPECCIHSKINKKENVKNL